MKKWMMTIIFITTCFTSEILLASSYGYLLSNQEPCQSLSGLWQGNVIIKGSFFTCHYTGEAQITAQPELTAQMSFEKAGNSSYLCLRHAEGIAEINCSGHNLDFSAEGSHLQGSLNSDHIHLAGQVTSPIPAEIELSFDKE